MTNESQEDPLSPNDEALLAFLERLPHGPLSGSDESIKPKTAAVSENTAHPADPTSEISPAVDPADDLSDCGSPDIYMKVALGTADKSEADRLLSHATGCTACARVLASSLLALEGNPSEEETAAIAKLAAARAEWRRGIANDLASTPTTKRPGFLRPAHWWIGSAVAATALLSISLYFWYGRSTAPEHLLAMAYTQSRTLELRIPEAGYADLTTGSHTRGASGDHEPAPLLDAKARLARELEHSPQNAHWQQLEARADILAEHYDAAADSLDRLLAVGPVNADLLVDAAAAYYQRGLVSGSESDRATALDYLSRADELAPTDPVVLFNEAIVMQDRGQMMNAVEVWNRYITVERDPRWAAEGKRKLAALEQTLNRLKSHQSRIDKMLATPQAMDALSADPHRLASLDEELSTLQLHPLTKLAFPILPDASGQARGSPCGNDCLASRKLLKALAKSLEIQHHDFWLTDLLSPDFDSLPASTSANYAQALDLLTRGMEEDQTGVQAEGQKLVRQARSLFQQLEQSGGAIKVAGHVGELRSDIEDLFSMQRQVDFSGCRNFARQLYSSPYPLLPASRYPWIEAQALVTEKVCDDTPETRRIGRQRANSALRLADANGYILMSARTQTMLASDSNFSGDPDFAERSSLAMFHKLLEGDPPPNRVAMTVDHLAPETDFPQAHTSQLALKESIQWFELAGNHMVAGIERLSLARADLRIGAVGDAETQLRLAREETDRAARGKAGGAYMDQGEILFAKSALERGDLDVARRYLDEAAVQFSRDSDAWAIGEYAATRGQLELASGHLDSAAAIMEADLRSSEGSHVRGGDRATVAEHGGLDHDIYAALAATWLAKGRSPASVLALWERFRLRSRGLPITQCTRQALDCELPSLLAAQRRLGNSIVIGQILLLDRVLTYHMDRNEITWGQRPLRRQDVLDLAEVFERAVSSPATTQSTSDKLGTRLSEALLAALPSTPSPDAALLLEPDPKLANLSWPALPTPAGPLGIAYPLAESRSILIRTSKPSEPYTTSAGQDSHALVIGASIATDGEPPLPEVLDEVHSVTRFLHSPNVLLGTQATRDRVAAALNNATILHFAGHAVYTPTGTELLLAAASRGDQTPWIDGAFLKQHPPRACRLAVLSACSTGHREASWNHPLQDVVETLGSVGVPEIVATRWQIDSEAAVPFMQAFYENLAKGSSVAMALTSARKLLSKQRYYSNPYYWGAYYATGAETSHLKGELHASL
jgi:CHAT domain-containing protein